MKKGFVFWLFMVLCLPAFPGNIAVPCINHCYDPDVKTVRLYREGDPLAMPLIQLGSGERIVIEFDDLQAGIRRFRFTAIHCDAAWNPSADLVTADYLEGFREEDITDYAYSYNTTIPYTNFTALFPTYSMAPRISGNYLLVVYDDVIDRLAFTARFMVSESSPATALASFVRSGAERLSRQQLDILLRLNGLRVVDVEREIKMVIMQNGQWDNLLRVGKPRFSRNDELDYRYDDAISFSGGNQYRNFDTRSLKYQTERVARIDWDTAFQVWLLADQPRTYKQYVYEQDLNGRYLVAVEEYPDKGATEADYTWVHFYLPYPAVTKGGTFHVLGELTNWELGENSRLYFNPARRGYELSLLLKQGYYNYMYVFRPDGQQAGDEGVIEGSQWETENDYTILVYFRETASLYDRLIAVTSINTLGK